MCPSMFADNSARPHCKAPFTKALSDKSNGSMPLIKGIPATKRLIAAGKAKRSPTAPYPAPVSSQCRAVLR